ncbi:amidohydrolase family protein [Candidatus Laterigemmans baculatus]|uniref:amidohydrolase family protein n=1 Tax=Candidatus Laterigemmans baculatus TaxID=2770505 RepID=UPI0013DD42C6|nr:amidohydrolase family protein [Candidatus Laterigemmans baculatus]
MRCPTEGSFRARWIVPVSRPPIHGGYLRCEGGRITHLDRTRPPGPVTDLGDMAILPGLVNAHTHLEFSDLREPIGRAPADDATRATQFPRASLGFADWAAAVVRSRGAAASDPDARAAAIAAGLAESARSGVVLIGEIATAPWPLEQVKSLGPLDASLQEPRLTLFAEILGLSPERQTQTWQWATSLESQASSHIALGLSPHAPYSTPPELVRRAVAHARSHQMPLAMHVAESREELQLLEHGEGPFRESLERMGVWRGGLFPHAGRIDQLLRELAAAPRTLVVHGNYLTPEQIAFLAGEPQMSVVYCPRTHAYFDHDRHPIAELWRAGVRVALGTDSRASTPDLSLWNEARFLQATRSDLPPENLLKAITADAADALGYPNFGRLEVGTSPGSIAVPTTASEARQLFDSLFEFEP